MLRLKMCHSDAVLPNLPQAGNLHIVTGFLFAVNYCLLTMAQTANLLDVGNVKKALT